MPRRKSVNFAPSASVSYVSEQSGMWYSNEEFLNIRQDLRNTVKRMMKHRNEHRSRDEDFCYLGLRTPEEFNQDKDIRYFAFQLVMTEQDAQLGKEHSDPEQIAEAYTYVASLQQSLAEKRAAALADELYQARTCESCQKQEELVCAMSPRWSKPLLRLQAV